MFTAKIQNSGYEFDIDIPERSNEVLLSQALRFNKAHDVLREWRKEQFGDNDKLTFQDMTTALSRKEYLIHVINCLAEFFDMDPADFFCLKLGSIRDHIMAMADQTVKSIYNNDLFSLFAHIYRIIVQYKPKLRTADDCSFMHKDVEFLIPAFLVKYLEGTPNEDLTVAESIEAFEVQRLAFDRKKTDEVSALYTEIVYLTAILARKPGQRLPDDQVGINAFIKSQVEFFADIDMETGFDVAFFLSNITKRSGTIQPISGTSILLK